MSRKVLDHFLYAAIKAIGMDLYAYLSLSLSLYIYISILIESGINICWRYSVNRPPPVKVGACRALSQLLPEANNEIIPPQLMDLFSSLTGLLNHVMYFQYIFCAL